MTFLVNSLFLQHIKYTAFYHSSSLLLLLSILYSRSTSFETLHSPSPVKHRVCRAQQFLRRQELESYRNLVQFVYFARQSSIAITPRERKLTHSRCAIVRIAASLNSSLTTRWISSSSRWSREAVLSSKITMRESCRRLQGRGDQSSLIMKREEYCVRSSHSDQLTLAS